MNVRFEGSSEPGGGWICQLPFPDQYRPTTVFAGAAAPTMDEAYGNLLDALVFEIVELREIVGMAAQ